MTADPYADLPDELHEAILAALFRNPDRTAAVDALIAAHPAHAARIRTLAGPADPAPAADLQQIGPYRILDVLGEGGMGTVYKAEQREPVRRLVAVKLIKLGMDSKEVVARFELERRALAAMSHGSIAKVYDVGTTDRGQPYFVMELVEGLPLTDYCDKHRLSLEDRILLFAQVCSGVQHAHQKGVIHRDLKPANILVVREGDQAVAKIVDFGLAKATNRDLLVQSVYTERDQMLGTPEYMAPEQAAFDHEAVDARADIYSLGVILYELLAGELPFSSAELRHAGWLEIQRKLREDEPAKPSTKLGSAGERASEWAGKRRTSLKALARELRGDLDWIVLKAMAKEPERRYDSASGLAADLRRYLDHDPVTAGPPSASYRLRKLVRRYRGQVVAGALVLATAVVGTVVSVSYAIAAEENATLAGRRADENAKLAKTNGDLAKEKGDKVREFNQLAGMVLYDRAVANEKDLYPPWPDKVAAMETWLREDCGKLLAMRERIQQTVDDLRKRALPQTEAEKQADLEGHPRFAEWKQSEQRLASLRRAQAIRDGAPLVVPELSAAQQALDANALNTLAWDRVAPKSEERKVYGEEAFGLACARAAVAKASEAERFQLLDTLAWALVENGQDEEARERSAQALAAAPEEQKAAYAGYQRDVEAAVIGAAQTLADLEARCAALDTEVHTRQTWTFAEEAPRFLHDTLSELLGKLASLEANEKTAVEQRLRWAEQIGALTRAHPNARVTWAAARAAIAASDRYRGRTVPLRGEDVVGLVPIGANPVTGLWEFYDLRSAWDGTSDPATIEIPVHVGEGERAGDIEVNGGTGIVFVLLPGGRFSMGAQKSDPDGANYDEQDESDGRLFEVTLSPFFLARHELTQGQWRRLTGEDPSYYKVGDTPAGVAQITLANPVEQVSWEDCDRWLPRYGLVLPTEAQWEYGCRAGTTTPWCCAAEDLQHHANLADATAKQAAPWTCESWTDGHAVHAPVGTFRANGFGLFDVHGNVWEWTRDGDYPSQAPRPGDGLRGDPAGSPFHVFRGGSFQDPVRLARSAERHTFTGAVRGSILGARPARLIQP